MLLGESFASISASSRSAGVPCPALQDLGSLKSDILDSLPENLQRKVMQDDFGDSFIFDHYDELDKAMWDGLDIIKAFVAQQDEFQVALEYFAEPELRIRADALILSGLCDPSTVSEALRGWSKYRFSEDAVQIYSFYFCNLPAMVNFTNWQKYIEAFSNKDQRWILSQAYDVQTKGDLVVLLDDLSVRAAIVVTPEETIQDLMLSAFVQTKKEERKIAEGVPAKSTAVFEWASMYCSMFDRVQKVLDGLDKESALDTVRTKLRTVHTDNIRRISDYDMASSGAA